MTPRERQAQERLWRAWQEFFLAEAWPKRDDFWAQMDGFFGEPRGNRELGNGSIFSAHRLECLIYEHV